MHKSKKQKRKWSWWPFDWHFWPDPEQLKIDSAYKIGFLSLLFCLGLYVYSQFNEVRVVNADIKAACLDKHVYYNVQDSDSTVTCQKFQGSAMAKILIRLPMTNREEQILRYKKDTPQNMINIQFYADTSEIYFERTNRLLAEYKKTRNSNKHIRNDSIYKIVDSLLYNEYQIEKSNVQEFLSFQQIHNNWEWVIDAPTLQAKFDSVSKNRATNTISTPLFYTSQKIYLKDNTLNKFMPFRFNDEELFRKKPDSILLYAILSHNKDKLSQYIETESFISKSYLNSPLSSPVHSTYSVKSPSYSPLLGNPGWLAMEDISQQYYNLRIKTLLLDSLTLKIDFVGATEFSSMNPEPDEIDMSSITFFKRSKLTQIEENGLTFHVTFKELQNKQNIRLFFLTSIIGGIVIILIVFLILVFYILFTKYKVKKLWEPWIRRFFAILLIYLIIVWIIFYYNWDKGSNIYLWGVPIPIALVISCSIFYVKKRKIVSIR